MAKEKTEEPVVDERSWFLVRTQSGTSQYLAADAKDAQAMHERVVPADTIVDVAPLAVTEGSG